MKYTDIIKPLVCMMTQSTCYRNTFNMTVKGVLWHSTGSNNPTIRRYVQPDDNAQNRKELLNIIGVNNNKNDWNHVERDAGLNGWIGKLADDSVSSVQTMPWTFRPWGCSSGLKGSCNNGWIQFEICEDGLTDPIYFEQAYKEACELTAYLCMMFNIDPLGTTTLNGVKVPTILCHNDSYYLGLGSGHTDVLHWFPKHNKSMADVRNDVANIIKQSKQEDVLDMTNLELVELVRKTVQEELKKEAVKYHLVEDVPIYWRSYIQELINLDVINGGTPKEVCDNDINISEGITKAVVIMMKYLDTKYRDKFSLLDKIIKEKTIK